jgi:hypothetical protein
MKANHINLKWHLSTSLIVALFSLFFDQKTPFLEIRVFNSEITVFVLCIAIGVLIDVDHIIDFWVNRGNFSKSLQQKFNEGKMFVIFHGFENIFLLVALSTMNPYLVFPTISYGIHLAMDAYSNKVDFWAYSYIVRFGRKLIIHSSSGKKYS